MEQTWRWFGPDDAITLPRDPPGRRDRHRHRAAPHPLRRGLDRRTRSPCARRRSRPIARSACAGAWWKACRCRSRSSWPTAICRSCSTTTAQSLRNLGARRRHHGLLQFHAGAGLDPHAARGAAARRRHRAALQCARVRRVRLLHAGAQGRRGRTRARRAGARPRLVRPARPKATRTGCWPTSWPGCRAPTTATTSPGLRAHAGPLRRHRPRRRCARTWRASCARSCPPPRKPACACASIPDDPPRPLFGLPRIVLQRRRHRFPARRRATATRMG